MIEAHELVKVFPTTDGRDKRAVDGLSFAVAAGEIYGLLGPNGAGKTTTLRMLSGLLTPTAGRAVLAGHDVADDPLAVKRAIGFMTADTGLYQRLSPRELLRYFGQLQGMADTELTRRADELIALLGMSDFADTRCGGLSTGQKQRTSIARVLLGDPPILILDEPTLGLDVLTNRVILDFIRQQGDRGKAVLLSTHYLDEAETLCDRFGLLHQGRLMAEGDLDDLRRASGEQRLSEVFLTMVARQQAVGAGAGA